MSLPATEETSMTAFCFRLAVCCCCLAGLGWLTKELAPVDLEKSTSRHANCGQIVDLPQAEFCVLLARADIRQELHLDAVQETQINVWLQDLLWQLDNRCPHVTQEEFRTLSEERLASRCTEIREFIEAALESADAGLTEILDPAQFERLQQLKLQRQGIVALQRADIAELLQLKKDQRGRIGEMPCLAFAPMSPRGVQLQYRAELEDILTTAQYEQWSNLIGAPFMFPSEKSPLELRLQGFLMCLNPRSFPFLPFDGFGHVEPQHEECQGSTSLTE
jgi:hypothetical protein